MTGSPLDPDRLHALLVDALEPIAPDWPRLDALTRRGRRLRRRRATLVLGFVTATSVAAALIAVAVVSTRTAGPTEELTAPRLVTTPVAPVAVRVVSCPTTGGATQPATAVTPSVITTTATGAAKLAAYVDRYNKLAVLGPPGWTCAALDAVDGGVDISVVPPGGAPTPSPIPFKADTRVGIHAVMYPACRDCKYKLLCPVMADAQDALTPPGCTATPPARERRSALSPDAVVFADPPHVVGDGAPSGGKNAANGVILRQSAAGGDPAFGETCTLPQSQQSVCAAALADFVQRYHQPAVTPTTPSCADRAKHRYLQAVSATLTNNRLLLRGYPATLVCGGPDDSHYNTVSKTTTVTLSTNVTVTVVVFGPSGAVNREIPPLSLPQNLRDNPRGRIFQFQGPPNEVTSVTEMYHP